MSSLPNDPRKPFVLEDWINPEMDPRLHGFCSRFPFSDSDSPARRDMVASQVSQDLPIYGNNYPRIIGPQDREIVDHTQRIVVPFDCSVRHIITPHKRSYGNDYEGDVYIIIESIQDFGYFDVVHVPYANVTDPQFGFTYIRTDRMKNLRENNTLEKGEWLAHSPSVDPDVKIYKSGMELNIGIMSSLHGIEDGAAVRKGLNKAVKVECFKTVSIPFGTKAIPINTFGTLENYKPMMGIGEYLDDRGILMVTRRIDGISDVYGTSRTSPLLGMITMDATSMMEIDKADTIWRGEPGARIVQLDVIRQNDKKSSMLTGMEDQLDRYVDSKLVFHKRLINIYEVLKNPRTGIKDLRLSEDLTRLIAEAMALVDASTPRTALKLNRGHEQLDEYEVRITYMYELNGSEGSKFTDHHGGKVVEVAELDDEHMPYDPINNVRADIILLDQSSGNRMNTGRDVYMAVTAAGHRLQNELLDELDNGRPDFWKYAWDRITLLYWCIDPIFENKAQTVCSTEELRRNHVELFLDNGLYIGVHYECNRSNTERIDLLDQHFSIRGVPIQYYGFDGEMIETEYPVLISSLRMMLLEKVADKATATASPLMQHFSIPANPNSMQKKTSMYQEHATRITGESEVQTLLGGAEPGTVAETFDRTSNTTAHIELQFSILNAENPMDIEEAIDRRQIPLKGGRPLAIVDHMFMCSGRKLTFLGDDFYNRKTPLIKRSA